MRAEHVVRLAVLEGDDLVELAGEGGVFGGTGGHGAPGGKAGAILERARDNCNPVLGGE